MSFRPVSIALVACLAAAWATPSDAALSRKLRTKVAKTVEVLDEFMAARDSEIPEDLLSDATCIVVMPDLTKGAVAIGGRYGKGLAACRRNGGPWGAPAFVEVTGGSIGLQIGGERIDLVLVLRGEDSARWLLKDKFTLGADASVAAGPWGRTAGAATDAALRAAILSYSRSKGAFAGAALDGAVLKQDRSDNAKLYGREMDARDILLPEKGVASPATPAEAQAFIDALDRHAPRQATDD